MFKIYWKTSWRNLWKSKFTTGINVFGLSIGMTAAVFIFIWVQNELKFDDYHSDAENIYRITSTIQVNKDEAWAWESAPMLLAEKSKLDIPEIENTARIVLNSWGGPVLTINHQLFSDKNTAWVDRSWFNIFHYDFLYGSANAFGSDPFTIILTESKAKKYFSEANPIGKMIRMDTVNYTVQGVVKDNPENSSFRFDVMMHMQGRLADAGTYNNDKTWNNFGYITFLKLRSDANTVSVSKKLNNVINKNRDENSATISLEPLTGMYFESNLQSSEMPHGNKKTTYIFGIIGLLLLITACINYVNLTTAKASLRAKEVSIRKIIGAAKTHLFIQFIIESITISVIAMLITLALVQLLLPLFNSITEKQFVIPLNAATLWQLLMGTLLLAIVLNGVYPAILLSSFKPLNVFRGKTLLQMGNGLVRKGLVVFQLCLSIVLITATIIIYRQLQFIQNSNPGYNVSQVMSIQVPWRNYSKFNDTAAKDFNAAIKHELLSKSAIESVSTGSNEIVNITSSSSGNADWDNRDTTYNPTIAKLSASSEFREMFDIKMADGKWFAADNSDQRNYIMNETAAKAFNMKQPLIGQRFTWGGDTGQVIGITKDFHYKGMHDKIGPVVITGSKGKDSYFFVKIKPGNTTNAISAAKIIWSKYIPDEPFTYNFLDDSFNRLYKNDIKTSQLIFIFSIIAILISALGLIGLSAFTAEQRIKEIGVRKVLGASVQQITGLLSKDFLKLVLIAIIIASPLAGWLMQRWLQDFAYRINLSVWIFIAAGLLTILIALLSVSFQSIRAALMNPVKSLRSE